MPETIKGYLISKENPSLFYCIFSYRYISAWWDMRENRKVMNHCFKLINTEQDHIFCMVINHWSSEITFKETLERGNKMGNIWVCKRENPLFKVGFLLL